MGVWVIYPIFKRLKKDKIVNAQIINLIVKIWSLGVDCNYLNMKDFLVITHNNYVMILHIY